MPSQNPPFLLFPKNKPKSANSAIPKKNGSIKFFSWVFIPNPKISKSGIKRLKTQIYFCAQFLFCRFNNWKRKEQIPELIHMKKTILSTFFISAKTFSGLTPFTFSGLFSFKSNKNRPL